MSGERAKPQARLPGAALWWVPAGLHLLFATACRVALDIDIEARSGLAWDAYWQTLPLAALRDDLLAHVLSLHAQPPLHNLLVGLLARASGDPLALLHTLYMGLGAAICSAAAWIVASHSGSFRLGLLVGCAAALYPSLLLYEAYPLYTLPSAFLIMAALFAVSRYETDRRERWLLLFVLALTLLVLLRSLYHPALLLLCLALVACLAGRRRRVLLLALPIALPALALGAHHSLVYGAPGGSSWAGCNLWKIASARHSGETLLALAQSGRIEPLVLSVPVFSPPAAYRAHGFDRHSERAGQNRNDLHNINVPAICALYGRSALALIAAEPWHYAGNVARAYARFSLPSSRHAHLRDNARRLGFYTTLVERGLLGEGLTRLSTRWWGRDVFGSFFFVLVPLAVALPAWGLLRARDAGILGTLRRRPLVPIAALLCAYTALVGSMADLGENERFKFPVELPVACVLAIAARRASQQRDSPQHDSPQHSREA